MDEPMHPDPLTNAQFRARRATHLAVKRVYQEKGDLAWAVSIPTDGPARCAFLEHEVVRVPVTQTDAAKAVILATSHPGRLFPLALSEAFGTIEPEVSIALDAIPRKERADIQGDEGHILTITVACVGRKDHTFNYNTLYMSQIDPASRLPTFHPVNAAKDLLRLYLLAQGSTLTWD